MSEQQGVNRAPAGEIVAAWKDAGARVGRMKPNDLHGTKWVSSSKPSKALGDLPAFDLREIPAGLLASLPVPDVPFALYQRSAQIAPAAYAELARFDTLRALDLGGNPVTDDQAAVLRELPQLELLSLAGSGVSAAGLAHVGALRNLRWLFLDQTRIRDGLHHLTGLTGLVWLSLERAALTEADVSHLGTMTGLERLLLGGTGFTDDDLAPLAGLTALRELDLRSAVLTGSGLVHLAGLKQLKDLDLGFSGVTDEALPHLTRLPALRSLGLRQTGVTQVAVLGEIATLRRLDLAGTGASGLDILALTRANSRLRVETR